MKVIPDDLTMAGPIIHVGNPHGDGLASEAPVAERHDGHTARFQHSVHLAENLSRPVQVVDTNNIRHKVELVVAIGKFGVTLRFFATYSVACLFAASSFSTIPVIATRFAFRSCG